MADFITVILPTYNPNLQSLYKTLQGLKEQVLPIHKWELIVIDNNSSFPVKSNINISWHPQHQILTEPRQGLTYARLKGFNVAKGDIIVMIDDDNVADPDYLIQVLNSFAGNPKLGVAGGKSIPLFEAEPTAWVKEFYQNLALRDWGYQIIVNEWDNSYPATAPIGAGMAIRKTALKSYIDKASNSTSNITDRKGDNLASGGDNEIVIEVLKSGWSTGYFPALIIHHIIPAQRLQKDYLARLINNTNRSWIQVLQRHHINPWKKIPKYTLPFRKITAWFTGKAWQSPAAYIRWRGACGTYDGLADINDF
jgi:glycosyltransferase involved in cell wall biosynthesis